MEPTWEDTEPLFEETEPNQEASFGKDLKYGLERASGIASNTPMGVVASGMDRAQEGADYLGEKGAEAAAERGANPYAAAALGTAVQMAPQIIGSMIPGESIPMKAPSPSPMASKLSRMASDARIKGFRVPGTAIDQTGELGAMRESVETLKSKGIQPKVFESAEDLGNRVKSGISEYGQMVREIPQKLDAHGIKPRLNPETIPQHLATELAPKYAGGAYETEAKIAQEIAETSRGHSDSFQGLLDLKQKLGEQGKFYRVNTGEPGAPLKAEMYQKAYSKVNEIIKNEIRSVAPELAPAWDQANDVYAAGKDVLPHLTKEAGKSAARNISDMSSVVKETSRRAIAPVMAYGADTVSRLVQSAPQMFGKFSNALQNAIAQGPKAFAVLHYTLSQKDPSYRDAIEKAANER
jgi:hypothetical protein